MITKASLIECAKRLIAGEPVDKAAVSIRCIKMPLYYRLWFRVTYSKDFTKHDDSKLFYCDVFEHSDEETIKGEVYGVIDEIIKLLN